MIPENSAMLYSFINLKLRDYYSSLSELCNDMDIDMEDIIDRLAADGYYYDETINRFKPE